MQSLKWISLGAALALVAACSRESAETAASAQTSAASSSSSGSGGAGGNPFATGNGGAGTSNSATSSPSANASTGSFGAGGAGGDGCGAAATNVLALLAAAQKCAFGGPLTQCTDIVGGFCCPVLVADKDSAQSNNYENALLQYQMSGCKFDCPPTPCDFMPKGVCAPQGPSMYQCSAQ